MQRKASVTFFKSEISYCGHVIDKHGLHKSQEKIEALLQAPRPENVSELRSYLGLINYYHKFLPNLANNITPPQCTAADRSKGMVKGMRESIQGNKKTDNI